ncbi:MAG: hypothetical protein KME22_09230 [Hassallia sp. WJT32-NPBG1]|nr:hypothetical protein [Hassallia sp. WJT32-NPBG1]
MPNTQCPMPIAPFPIFKMIEIFELLMVECKSIQALIEWHLLAVCGCKA